MGSETRFTHKDSSITFGVLVNLGSHNSLKPHGKRQTRNNFWVGRFLGVSWDIEHHLVVDQQESRVILGYVAPDLERAPLTFISRWKMFFIHHWNPSICTVELRLLFKALMKNYLVPQDNTSQAISLLILVLGTEEWAFCSSASD